MQSYFYNENNQTENILPVLLATSSSELVNSGTVIMPHFGAENESAYPTSYLHYEKRFQLIDYSLPQISQSFNLPGILINGATTSTFYTHEVKDKVANIETESMNQRFIMLFKILGKELFNKLSYTQLLFMAKTAGAIDLGQSVDIKRMYGYINQY